MNLQQFCYNICDFSIKVLQFVTECKVPKCLQYIKCKFGVAKDSRGCYICDCNPDPCKVGLMILGQEKNVLVLVIGLVDFDANKKNAGRKI